MKRYTVRVTYTGEIFDTVPATHAAEAEEAAREMFRCDAETGSDAICACAEIANTELDGVAPLFDNP